MNTEFLPEAEQEYIEAIQFYDLRVLGLGGRFVEEVERAAGLLDAYPEIGRRIDGTFRRIHLNRFPYSLVYTVESDKILIVAVAHHRRHPRYWQTRRLG